MIAKRSGPGVLLLIVRYSLELELDAIALRQPEDIVLGVQRVGAHEFFGNSQVKAGAHAAEFEIFGEIGPIHSSFYNKLNNNKLYHG
jgi:hypothetical protein